MKGGDSGEASVDDAVAALWAALRAAPEDGRSVKDLMAATSMGRSWVYARLQELAAAGPHRPHRPWSLGPR